jgi:hypothetical protein
MTMGVVLLEGAKKLDTGKLGHDEVGHDDIGLEGFRDLVTFLTVTGCLDLEAPASQPDLECCAHGRVVLHDEYFRIFHGLPPISFRDALSILRFATKREFFPV